MSTTHAAGEDPTSESGKSAQLDRRQFLGAAAATLGASAFNIGTASAADVEVLDITPDLIKAAQREGTIVVRYGSPVDEMMLMANAFEKQFGVKVLADRKVGVLGTQQFVTEERAGKHVLDVNYSADPHGILTLGEEGLYLRFVLKDLDKKLDPTSYLSNVGYCARTSDAVIAYNPDFLPHDRAKELFKTWHGLLDPSLRGKIGMTEPGGGGIPFATYFMFYKRPEYGRDFLVKLAAQKPRLYTGSAPAREDLAAGATSVFIPSFQSAAMIEFMKGDKTAWTYPEVAPSYANGYLCISKNAPHPNAARLFTAWFFTQEGARHLQLSQQAITLKGVPEERPAVPLLQKTSWWQPYPESIKWVPDMVEWQDRYEELLKDMRGILGYRT